MITAQDLKGALAIMPTPAKPGAERLDATNTVDLDETARLAEALVRDGANGIMALGTMGECATTSQADYEAYVDCLLQHRARPDSDLRRHNVAQRPRNRPPHQIRQRTRRHRNAVGNSHVAAGQRRDGGEILCRCRRDLSRFSNHGLRQPARLSLRLRRRILATSSRQSADGDVGEIFQQGDSQTMRRRRPKAASTSCRPSALPTSSRRYPRRRKPLAGFLPSARRSPSR